MSTQTATAPQTPSKALTIGLWVLQALLAFAMFMAGVMKLTTGQEEMIAGGMAWAGRVPAWLILFIGVSEVLGAIGLVVPAATRILPILTPVAAAALGLVMVLAAGEHAMNGELSHVPVNLVFIALFALIAWGRGVKAPIAAR